MSDSRFLLGDPGRGAGSPGFRRRRQRVSVTSCKSVLFPLLQTSSISSRSNPESDIIFKQKDKSSPADFLKILHIKRLSIIYFTIVTESSFHDMKRGCIRLCTHKSISILTSIVGVPVVLHSLFSTDSTV